MTPKEIAARLVRSWYAGPYRLHHDGLDQEIADVAEALRAYGDAMATAERKRCQAITARRASEWRAILSEQPGSVIADNRWHEACDIGALISQPDRD